MQSYRSLAAGRGLMAGVVLSAGLHLLGLQLLANEARSATEAPGGGSGSAPLRVELVAATAPPAVPAPAAAVARPGAPSPAAEPSAARPVSTERAWTPEPAAPLAAGQGGEAGWDLLEHAYVAADRLAQRPIPVGDVDVPYPEREHQEAPISVVMTLFLDESGHVDFLRLQDPVRDDAWTQAATQAFEGATFAPGVLDGHPVKSRMRIEVTFDVNAAPETLASSGRSAR